MNGLKILEHDGEGYLRLVNGAKWTLAALNYADRFDEKNIVDFERHNLTDETFVLLRGEATLLMPGEARRGGAPETGEASETFATRPRVAEDVVRIPMEPFKCYNVGAGVWHNIVVSKDARVLIAENANTSKDNTDYLDRATGRIFRKRPTFEEVLPGTYLLKVPFGSVWTGVVLVRGRRGGAPETFATRPRVAEEGDVNVLIDSSHLEPEQYLIPALADLGMKVSDIDWLLNTHVHGDHIGGHHALVTKYGLRTATLDSAADALRDPVKVAIRVRARFPNNSPAPQSDLKGVEPDTVLAEGELLEGRFFVFATPGHDDDCLTWIDTWTGTAFTGDSLQANGTPCQGIAFYRSLSDYRATLEKLNRMCLGESSQGGDALPAARKACGPDVPAVTIRNIVCGHVYDGIGDVIRGADAVRAALDYSIARVKLYGEKIRAYVGGLGVGTQGGDALPTTGKACGPDVPAAASEDESVLVPLALKLIGEVGCGMPEALFLALHTVSEHLKEMGSET